MDVVVVVVLDKSDRESLATSSASSVNLVKNSMKMKQWPMIAILLLKLSRAL